MPHYAHFCCKFEPSVLTIPNILTWFQDCSPFWPALNHGSRLPWKLDLATIHDNIVWSKSEPDLKWLECFCKLHFDEFARGGRAFQQVQNFHEPNHEEKQIYWDLQSCRNSGWMMDENFQKRLVAGKPHTIGLNQWTNGGWLVICSTVRCHYWWQSLAILSFGSLVVVVVVIDLGTRDPTENNPGLLQQVYLLRASYLFISLLNAKRLGIEAGEDPSQHKIWASRPRWPCLAMFALGIQLGQFLQARRTKSKLQI